jgi:hypothetical protein
MRDDFILSKIQLILLISGAFLIIVGSLAYVLLGGGV